MARSFRHLTDRQIRDIIARHIRGDRTTAIAREFKVDHSTIIYQIRKYQQSYPEEGGIYAYLKIEAEKTCIHPSGKCTLCGKMTDQIRREERQKIVDLTRRLSQANEKLRVLGMPVE